MFSAGVGQVSLALSGMPAEPETPTIRSSLFLSHFLFVCNCETVSGPFIVKVISFDKVPCCLPGVDHLTGESPCWPTSVTTFSPVLTCATIGPGSRKSPAHRLSQFAAGQRDASSSTSSGSCARAGQATARRCQGTGWGGRGRVRGGHGLNRLP